MKKLYSLFILSILALTMFVGCQMPTDGTGNGAEAVETEYTITVVAPHGTVELDKTKAKAGETVRLTITPDSGYVLDSLSVKMSDTEITTTLSDDKTYATFTMPNGNVSVEASFKTATATPTVDADEATYGFTKTVNYAVVANGQSLPGTKTGAELIAIAKDKNLVKDTDYTINGTTVILTASGVEKFFGNTDNGNTSSGDNTSTYTVSVKDSYTTVSNSSYKLVIQNSPIDGYKKDDQVEILITNGNQDVNTGIWETPEGLYLVKVHIKEGETELNIEDVKVENHKITFTMPDKNINVFAEFCDIRYQKTYVDEHEVRVINRSGNEITVVLCFNSKAYDNLKEVDGKYAFKVDNLESNNGSTSYTTMYFTKLCDKYELRKTGTLDDGHYMLGVIDNDELTILESTLRFFNYEPNAGLQSN